MQPPLYLCIHLRDFATLALTSFGKSGSGAAVAVLSGEPPLEQVFALNSAARALDLACGMSRLQAESFGAVLLQRDLRQEELAFAALLHCAERWAPRVEIVASPCEQSCGATLLLDISGSQRLLGTPSQIASAVYRAIEGVPHIRRQQTIMEHQRMDELSIAVAHHACAAVLAARGIPGSTTIPRGRETVTLTPLPLCVLQPDEEQAQTLEAWGIRTLGQLAALEPRALAARMGQSGLRLQRQARGDSDHFLVPNEAPADAPISASLQLEHPVELLEPLLFLLNQLLEQVIAGAQQRAFAIASLELTLLLENAIEGGPFKPTVGLSRAVDVSDRRTIRPALPERERLNLLKLIQLELETHPPSAPIAALRLVAHPAPPQTAQQGLFAAQAPEPGKLEILLARLRKLAGEGRVGSPELLDSRAREPFRMMRFAAGAASVARFGKSPPSAEVGEQTRSPALRMLRPPRAVAIELRGGSPAAMHEDGKRLLLQTTSGPWRSSGEWWTQQNWIREEWDVSLQADPQRLLRLAHDPANRTWYVIGMYD